MILKLQSFLDTNRILSNAYKLMKVRNDFSSGYYQNISKFLSELIMGLKGKTPSEACGIKIEGQNKWIILIQNASKTS